jgi:hypothetical protein
MPIEIAQQNLGQASLAITTVYSSDGRSSDSDRRPDRPSLVSLCPWKPEICDATHVHVVFESGPPVQGIANVNWFRFFG